MEGLCCPGKLIGSHNIFFHKFRKIRSGTPLVISIWFITFLLVDLFSTVSKLT